MLIVIYSSIVEKSPRVVSNASLSRQPGMGAYATRLYWLQFRKMFRFPRGLNFGFQNYIALKLNIASSL